ncbi:uncharacterized protein LOC131184395 [Ahaetulla prasina]|uniref:uncharacterized protein LOC131184395 n=1 Tax=Ahaetulla prasina TaxID=499056 RepID=UPI002647DB67|nr:uncharacterized protein LOC131184395 [Ahaetulla prasina]
MERRILASGLVAPTSCWEEGGKRAEGKAGSHEKMEQLEEKLAKEVRRYKHLYDATDKNPEVTANSWRELEELWRKSQTGAKKSGSRWRDKFVRLKKRMQTKSGDPGDLIPAYYLMLAWLERFITHKEIGANFNGVAAQPEDDTPSPLGQNSLDSTLKTEDISSTPYFTSRDSSVFRLHSSEDEGSTSVSTVSSIQERGRRWEGTRYWTLLSLYAGSGFKLILQ